MSKYSLIILVIAFTGCREALPPERKAIDVVKASHALGGMLPVDQTIENWLKEKKDEVKPFGWEANKQSDDTYLVSFAFKIYSWDKGSGEERYFFLVNLSNESVQNVTNKFKRQTKPLSAPYKDEEDISEQVIQKILQEEEILSGKQLTSER